MSLNMFDLSNIAVIQGGMGFGVSSWRLAQAVASYQHPSHQALGVVSLTGIDLLFHRRVHLGIDIDLIEAAIASFPNQEMAQRVFTYAKSFKGKPPLQILSAKRASRNGQIAWDMAVVGAFVEVSLAKRGHDGLIGVNLLTKIQEPTMPALLGALLAGADVVIMGAGIPNQIPGILDDLAAGKTARQIIHGGGNLRYQIELDPLRYYEGGPLTRPAFLPIVTIETLAKVILGRWPQGSVQGMVIENPTAGGHNAGPRKKNGLDELGQPLYGAEDYWTQGFETLAEAGLPFWLAGGYADPNQLWSAWSQSAKGIQVGTLFAYTDESGLLARYKQAVIANEEVNVFTDPLASPTNYPFKVVQLPGTTAEEPIYRARPRVCDVCYLREPFTDEAGEIDYRCPSEPVEDYLAKGGTLSETVGRKCVCNGLVSAIGLNTRNEPAILTSGDDLDKVRVLHRNVNLLGELTGNGLYQARHVLDFLLN